MSDPVPTFKSYIRCPWCKCRYPSLLPHELPLSCDKCGCFLEVFTPMHEDIKKQHRLAVLAGCGTTTIGSVFTVMGAGKLMSVHATIPALGFLVLVVP